jgi:hypothetical protein
MRYLLFALALLGTISVATVTYAEGQNSDVGGEHNGVNQNASFCGTANVREHPLGDEC